MRASRVAAVCAVGVVGLLSDGVAGAEHASSRPFQTSRAFALGGGRIVRTFTFRERSGVILVNRLTVPRGARVRVDARIPGLAGAGVESWPQPDDPTLACSSRGGDVACTQGEEWCPMPRAVWRFRLVKLGGPAARVRFDYVVAPPPGEA